MKPLFGHASPRSRLATAGADRPLGYVGAWFTGPLGEARLRAELGDNLYERLAAAERHLLERAGTREPAATPAARRWWWPW